MPGGLPEIVQAVGADTSRYIQAYKAAREEVRGLSADHRELMRTIADVQRASGNLGLGGAAQDTGRVNAAIRDHLKLLRDTSAAAGDFSRAIGGASAAGGEFARAQAQAATSARGAASALGDLAAGHEKIRGASGGSSAAVRSYTSDLGKLREAARDTSGTLADTASAIAAARAAGGGAAQTDMQRAWDSDFSDFTAKLKAKILAARGDVAQAAGVADAAVSTAVRDAAARRVAAAADAVTGRTAGGESPLAAGLDALARNLAGAGGGWKPGDAGASADALRAAGAADVARVLRERAAAGSGPAAARLAQFGLGGGPGGGGPGGGGMGALLGGPGGGGGGSTAASQFATLAAFTRVWGPRVHWALMATNEVLSTVGPALAAAGAAAMVGAQGGEQLANRWQAIQSVSESLGPSLNQTAGSFLGVGSALQKAQDTAAGGVYQMAGAGINIARSGPGGSLIQMGSNTIAMLDRAMAGLTADAQGGMGTRAAGLVAGGTGYLQQFGQVIGNISRTFLNTAPNLPGVGGDYLSILQAGTRGLANVTGFAGAGMAPLLAYEAAARLGTPLVGGAGALLGHVPGLGTAARVATAADVGAGAAAAAGDTIAGTGLAGLLGGLAPTTVGAAGALALLIGKGATYQDPAQQWGAGLQSQVNQANFTQGFGTLISGMNQAAGIPPSAAKGAGGLQNYWQGAMKQFSSVGHGDPGGLWGGSVQAMHGTLQILGIGAGSDPTKSQVAQGKLQQFASTFVNLSNAGQQVQQVWKGVSHETVGMAQAYDIATQAQLQLGSAFSKNGLLSDPARQMIRNLQAAYAPMAMNGGQFGASIGASTAMGGLGKTEVSSVNSAWDQMMQIISAGPAGSSGLFGMLGGTPVTRTRTAGGLRLSAPPAFQKMAKALTSFTTTGGAAAWNTFAGPRNSLVQAAQSQMDWLRTAQTMGAATAGATTGMGAFELQQLLPLARKSPAALATLSGLTQQLGAPALTPGASQAQNYKAMSDWITKAADSSARFQQHMTGTTQALANVSRDAQHFVTTMTGDATSQMAAKAATDMNNVLHGSLNAGAVRKWVADLGGQGLGGQGIQAVIDAATKKAGLTAGMQRTIHVAVQADVAGAQAKIGSLHGKTVTVGINANTGAVQGAINAVHGKTVTISVNTIVRQIGSVTGSPGGVPYTAAGAVANAAALYTKPSAMTSATNPYAGGISGRAQTGMKIPGYGGGDIVPIMAEPGELVVPKHLVPSVAPILGGKIPGFAAGGTIGPMDFTGMMLSALAGDAVKNSLSHLIGGLVASAAGAAASSMRGAAALPGGPLPQPFAGRPGGTGSGNLPGAAANQAAAQALQSLAAAAKGPGGTRFSVEILKGIAAASLHGFSMTWSGSTSLQAAYSKALQGQLSAAATGAAKAMISRIQTEVAYAKSTTASLAGGLNFGSTDTTQGPVQSQMQDYAASLKTFSGDMKSMSKAGLNKDLMRQMIAAGPVQGDALAQSISTGPGGVKAVNQLYAGIQHLASRMGAQSAGAVYGGTLAPNLKSGTFISNNVSITVSTGGAGAAALGGLSNAQIKQLTGIIQAKLLQQAKRNRRTGTTLPGYGN